MARQQTNKIMGEKKTEQRGGIEQSTRDASPLLSCLFFHLMYFCFFCLFLHLRHLVSHMLSKGAGCWGLLSRGSTYYHVSKVGVSV